MRGLIRYFMMFSFLLAAGTAFADDLGLVRLSLIEGDVQVLIKDTSDWTAGAVNLPLTEGDRMWVPDNSRAELQIQGGVYVRSDMDTALDVLTITADSAQFYVDRGHIYINNRRGGIKTVQVDTPMSSVRSYDNSIMMIDVTEDGVTEISVLKGYVYAESRAGATRVSAGNTLTIRGETNADVAPLGAPDDWERWNTERDRTVTAWGESSRYLPDELHEYSSDFDENGQWQYTPDYGYVWTPTAVPAGWAPYTAGNWIWIRGSFVWIDYDPWGWAPCHYGRWVFSSYGWSWVPPSAGAVYWGPGYVGWIVTPTYVAWVPLAPGEVYYGYGYYGPWSRNVAAGTVGTVTRRYVNARVNSSVVVVQRESFGTGRRIPVKTGDNPFLDTGHVGRQENIVPPRERPRTPITIVSPERREHIRNLPPAPERTHPSVPVARTKPETRAERPERPAGTPQASAPQPTVQKPPERQLLPPERFRNIKPEELKNERRLVKDREASVFKPRPPDNLPVRKMNEPKIIIRKPAQPQKSDSQGGSRERRPGR